MLRDFTALYDFPLDDFQLDGCRAIEEGRGALARGAHGPGKTVVGEFAVHLAMQTGRKCFYTTPIKALSNQKYHDLVARYGPEQVGLLTGDNVVNGEAPVVVMTTEVLRNMLYAGSRTLLGLGFVVMDEVHYLADRSRARSGEVIIHLPESVSWSPSRRPSPTPRSSASGWRPSAGTPRRSSRSAAGAALPARDGRPPGPGPVRVLRRRRGGRLRQGGRTGQRRAAQGRGDDWASSRVRDRRSPRDRNRRGTSKYNVGNGRRVWVPSRPDLVAQLDRQGLLPAIDFIFSRVGCDAAVTQCLGPGYPAHHARGARRDLRARRGRVHLPSEDLHALGYRDFLDGLTRGVAAHHAGMLPAFKQVVEELFVRGLCKVVFATETLALGINMPARTVVIEKLSKWNGENHADITPGSTPS